MIEYNSQALPTPEEFRKAPREASEQYDPVEELLRLQRELDALEQRYQLSSAECYRRFAAGGNGRRPGDLRLGWALPRLHAAKSGDLARLEHRGD